MSKPRRVIREWMGKLFSRPVLTILLLLLQVVWLFVLWVRLTDYSKILNLLGLTVSILMCMALIRKDSTVPEFKISWMVLFMIMPVQGGILYLMWGDKRPAFRLRRRLQRAGQRVATLRQTSPAPLLALEQQNRRAAATARYVWDYGPCPVYGNSRARYYPSGEAMFPDVLAALESAQRYIFIEIFILGTGEMWEAIHDILRRKAAAGVEVRVIYDDAGSLTVLPGRYWKTLEAEGIHALTFNPFVPWLNLVMNNRDHRKIIVVDGVTAFTGGVNIADEYINRRERFGYWKDSAVRLQGDAAWSLTTMFLEFWDANRPDAGDLRRFQPAAAKVEPDGLIQPFCDSPVDRESVAKSVCLELINQAQWSLYICTPYLILDNDTLTALRLAAKRGVDVRIYTPGIPDKKMIYQLSRSYFSPLMDAGVQIYRYLPGFLHGKTWLVDGRIGMVGSVNLDYRSLYLHFECGALLYGCSALEDIRSDFVTLQRDSRLLTKADCRTGVVGSFVSAILRMLAPLC